LVVVAGWKRGQKIFQFSIPKIPEFPELRGLCGRSREKKKVKNLLPFGLVPLVTHPSSIPLLGGLTPKFLGLSFHSL
jgi:hypothetical protein